MIWTLLFKIWFAAAVIMWMVLFRVNSRNRLDIELPFWTWFLIINLWPLTALVAGILIPTRLWWFHRKMRKKALQKA